MQIRLLPDGECDPPTETRITTDNPGNLLTDVELAKELLALVKTFDEQLGAFLQKAEKYESPEEFRELARSVGSVWVETESKLTLPVLRRHSSLIPEERRDGWI